MEKIYSTQQKDNTLIKAQPQTVQFLLDYSKSLHISKTDGLTFENNLN